MIVTNGVKNERTIHPIEARKIVDTEAFPVIATHPIDSPYVVLAAPPKNPPTIDPKPSPRRVLSKPGSVIKSLLTIFPKFL